MIDFSSFHLATRINSQNTNDTVLINEPCHINLYMNIGNPKSHNCNFDPTYTIFLNFFLSFHDYWPPTPWISSVHNAWGEMHWCDNVIFRSSKKKIISCDITSKCVTEFYWQLVLRVLRIIRVIQGWAHKKQRFTLISIKIIGKCKFFVYI